MTGVAPAVATAARARQPVAEGGGAAAPFSAWERDLAGRYLRTTRKNGGVTVISWIAFVGIMLSVAVLIIVMSVMNGFRTDLLSRILGFSGHVFVQGPAIQQPASRDALLARLRAVPGVVSAAPVIEAQTLATGPASRSGAVVRGVDPAELGPRSLVVKGMKEGGLSGFGQGEYGGDRVLVGSGLADSIGVHAGDPVDLISPDGDATVLGSSTPREKSYQAGGVFTVGASNFDGAYIYMPLAQAQLFFGRGEGVDFIEIKVADPDHLERYLPAIRRAAGEGSVVNDWRDRSRSFWSALQTERNVMRLILMMVVAIAVLNIISGLIMLVKNKTRDIAILRTMGAGRGAVLRVFFMAGAAIGVSGAVAGLLLGALFSIFIDQIQAGLELVGIHVWSADTYYLSRIPARIEWSEVGWIMAFALIMSFLATLPPAWWGSRLDPVEALGMSSAAPVLALRGVGRTYTEGLAQPLTVLHDVDLDVAPGEIVGLIGPSGSGKSSLLHAAGLLERPTTGRVAIDGRDASDLPERARTRIRLAEVGFVYQFHHLLPELSAVDNVALPLRIAGKGAATARDRAAELLTRLGLGERLAHAPPQLSGGEQQRVAIARAMANRPRLILADEPTGNLDPATSGAVFQSLFDLARLEKVGALIATHNLELAGFMDRVFALHEGQLQPHVRAGALEVA